MFVVFVVKCFRGRKMGEKKSFDVDFLFLFFEAFPFLARVRVGAENKKRREKDSLF